MEAKEMINLQFHTSPNESAHKPLTDTLDTAILHRLNVGATAKDAVHAFSEGLPELVAGFGGRFPYHFFVDCAGTVTQVLPLSKRGLHARQWNSHSVAVALGGDFTRHGAPVAQWRSAAVLVALLGRPQGWLILGHDEAPGGSRYLDKRCPGDMWPMGAFREVVADVDLCSCDINNFWGRVRC